MTLTIELRKNTEERMRKGLEALRHNLSKIRTGRVHTGLLDGIEVEYYGSLVPINQVGSVSLLDGRTLGVQIFEKKMVGVVERAIRDSDLGLNPATQGDIIRVPMPALTEERRKDLTKVVKNEGEEGKIVLRNIRREANESLKKMLKEKAISEDDERSSTTDVQKLTDKYIAETEKVVSEKEADIMKV
jgi:ribosome recycling factor